MYVDTNICTVTGRANCRERSCELHYMDAPVNLLPTGPSIVDRNLDWSLVDLTAEARVARGVLYVDRVYPKTLAYLNPDTFSIELGDRCVLGQIHGKYVGTPEWDLGSDFCKAHGFLGFRVEGGRATWEDERDLNRLWRKAIYAARDRA